MEVGETFEHTFTVPGTYVYVCVPHAGQGMIGRVIVNE
jgi:plastocyanin